jgi:hypothetical protein
VDLATPKRVRTWDSDRPTLVVEETPSSRRSTSAIARYVPRGLGPPTCSPIVRADIGSVPRSYEDVHVMRPAGSDSEGIQPTDGSCPIVRRSLCGRAQALCEGVEALDNYLPPQKTAMARKVADALAERRPAVV